MNTVITDDPQIAAGFVRAGGIVAFPTETVYGLGADLFDPAAVRKVFEAKGRPADNPLIVHIENPGQLAEVVLEVPPHAGRFVERFFPGPLTLVLKRSSRVPDAVTAGLDTVGVRMPSHELARKFLAACGSPMVAPSANLSGRPSPTTWQAVLEDLDGRIECILKGERTAIGLESTVVDCTGERPVLLRKGAVSLETLREVVPDTLERTPGSDDLAKSPGLRHRHYSPKAGVVIGEGVSGAGPGAAFIGLRRPGEGFELVKVCSSVGEYARELFEFFRECDRRGIEMIVCGPVPETGIGAALMDRLRRAAEPVSG